MNYTLSIVVHTANILGIFSDPFEFEGDYGQEANQARQQVFELVVSPEALAKNLPDAEVLAIMEKNNVNGQDAGDYRRFLIAEAVKKEKEHGPTLSQLVTPELIEELKKTSVNDEDLAAILRFIALYKDQKVFHFLRNNPKALLTLDKPLRDQAAKEGKEFDLPILGSTKSLEGKTSFELKRNLLQAVFTKQSFELTVPQESVIESLNALDKDYLKGFFGEDADNQDLQAFSTPTGQVFFYWMYQALNLHLISQNEQMVEQVNKVKDIFARTLGNASNRAHVLRNKLIEADTAVLFTQESDAITPLTLTGDGLFLPVHRQNPEDGTFVFLRSDLWEPDYEVVAIEGYEGYEEGLMNVVVATRKDTGERYLLAACHGHSTKPEDGRLQISLVMEAFHRLSDGNLQLLIGTDANTKTEEDVVLFLEHLDSLGLVGTEAGPTTVKKRMVTTQHQKAGRFAIDQEDYLITLKPENGGKMQFSNVSVGFKEEPADTSSPLPNIHNLSDHYPVGALVKK